MSNSILLFICRSEHPFTTSVTGVTEPSAQIEPEEKLMLCLLDETVEEIPSMAHSCSTEKEKALDLEKQSQFQRIGYAKSGSCLTI